MLPRQDAAVRLATQRFEHPIKIIMFRTRYASKFQLIVVITKFTFWALVGQLSICL